MMRMILAVLVALVAGPVVAEKASQSYSVYVGGLKAGSIGLAMDVSSRNYVARGVVKADGLLALFADFGFDGTVRGTISDNSVSPRNYEGEHRNRSGERLTVMTFSGNRPTSVKLTPPKDRRGYDIDPLAQSGTVDPVSASFLLLRDRPMEMACNQKIEIFDGTKRSRITLGTKQATEDGYVCQGEYRRLAGFSPRQMEKQSRFGFKLFLREENGMAVVEKFHTESVAGTVVAIRR